MAETSIAVQPVGQQGPPAAAPLPLKLVQVPDGSGTATQGVTLFDDQGRALVPLSEATGQLIVKLLSQLVAQGAQAGNGLLPADDTTSLGNPG